MKKMKRITAVAVSLIVLIAGTVAVFSQSSGYTVFYEDKALGFVDEPSVVLNNIEKINESISEARNAEATIYRKAFSFEKGFRLFCKKSDWEDIAAATNEKCNPDINVYDIYIDSNFVAQASSLEKVMSTVERIKKEYSEAHPEDNFTKINFVERLEICATKAKSVEPVKEEDLYSALNDMLTIKTISEVREEKTVAYEIIYEPTDVKECGETTVKIPGVDGRVETVTQIERHDGIQVASAEIETKTIDEVVNQVVLVGTKGLVVSDSGMISPSRGVVTSTMGKRWGRVHKGIDIPGNTGDPIYSSKEGTVTVAEYKNNGYGNVIEIDHGNGLVTLYAHLNSISVKPGDFVYPGQVIGGMGTTGRSTGVHLHFEVIQNGVNVNPLSYVKY